MELPKLCHLQRAFHSPLELVWRAGVRGKLNQPHGIPRRTQDSEMERSSEQPL